MRNMEKMFAGSENEFFANTICLKKCSQRNQGHPINENIVQNHLNMALSNVFRYLNGRYRHIFIP